MTTFTQRRWRNSIITLFVAAVLIALHQNLEIALYESSVASGWLLIFIVLGLIIFRIRKKNIHGATTVQRRMDAGAYICRYP